MITTLAQIITDFLYKNKTISASKLDIYIYGFEILISNIVCISIAITLGIITNKFYEMLFFLLSFTLLRKYCGGFHAETYFKCGLIFTVDVIVVLALIQVVTNYPIQLHVFLYLIGLVLIMWKAPIENKYKPLTGKEKNKYKKLSILLCILLFLISTFLYKPNLKYCFTVDMAFFTVTLFMAIGSITKGGDNSEGNER